MIQWEIMTATATGDGIMVMMGNRVKELRERLGMTQSDVQAQLAQRGVEVHQAHVSKIERHARMPSVEVLRALADVLETNTDYLLGRSDDDSPPSDREDQVIATIEDPTERAVVQALVDALARSPRSEKIYIAELIQRLLPKSPRIIGGE